VTAVPEEARQALPVLEHCLGDSLVAVHLHGSAMGNGLRPLSDVDLLAVVNRPTTPEVRKLLVEALLPVSGRYPAPPGASRPIELTVLLLADLQPAPYPARVEFVYGEWLRADFETGAVPEPNADPGHTLLLAQARSEAQALKGAALPELLAPIPPSDVRRAIGEALPSLVGNLKGDERNVLLTLARMWRTLSSGEFVPKDVAARWAAAQLPAGPSALLSLAADGYLGAARDDWNGRERDVEELVDLLRGRIATLMRA
jgi:streptomycin 3"-adenylyltransferase